MAKKIDWVKKDEEARKAYIAETGREITYGKFRHLHPELVPSINEKHLQKKSIVTHSRSVCASYRHLTAEDDEIIKNEFLAGATKKELAARFRTSSRTISNHLSAMGVFCEERDLKRWEASELETLITMHFEGFSNEVIATVLNRTPKAIADKKHKIRLKKSGCARA